MLYAGERDHTLSFAKEQSPNYKALKSYAGKVGHQGVKTKSKQILNYCHPTILYTMLCFQKRVNITMHYTKVHKALECKVG